MRNFMYWSMVVSLCCLQSLIASETSGSYRESGNQFTIGFALAERADDGTVRILLMRQNPELPDRDQHLDRLEAVGQAAEGGYLMLEPTSAGDRFNITVSLDGFSFGGGGQYESKIEFSNMGAKGTIESDVLNGGELKVNFEAEYLAPRLKKGDLPTDGGAPGAVLLEQMRAVASGDREAILRTLQPDQQEQFNQMPADEQAEALSFLVDLTPRDVKVTAGSLYDGYAIVEFTGVTDGVQATGRALITQQGDQWLISEVSTKLE